MGKELTHLAIIMDGNGRWASKRGLMRSIGHKEGIKAVRSAIRFCLDNGIPYLSLFCFSKENWKRPETEVRTLFAILSECADRYLPELLSLDVSVRIAGSRDRLPKPLIEKLDNAIASTSGGRSLILQLMIDYSGSEEIARAVNRAIRKGIENIDERAIRANLDNPDIPDVDFLIRTGGEKRLSGFLTYQSSYAELGFYDKLWPDWDEASLRASIEDYRRRDRRFGGLNDINE